MHGMGSGGGSSSDGEAEQEFWIWPVPESGDIELVCEWPAYGIGESRLTVSGDELRAAAARARVVWPEDLAGDPHGPSRPSSRHGVARMRGRSAFTGITTAEQPASAAGLDDAGTPEVGAADQASE